MSTAYPRRCYWVIVEFLLRQTITGERGNHPVTTPGPIVDTALELGEVRRLLNGSDGAESL